MIAGGDAAFMPTLGLASFHAVSPALAAHVHPSTFGYLCRIDAIANATKRHTHIPPTENLHDSHRELAGDGMTGQEDRGNGLNGNRCWK